MVDFDDIDWTKTQKDDFGLVDNKDNRKKNFNLDNFIRKNKFSLITLGLGVFLLGIGVLSTIIMVSKKEEGLQIISSKQASSSAIIYVHVAGAVEKPGLYQLTGNSRVNDALISAGGLSAEADRDWFNKTINLAQKLVDGVKLYIPFKKEVDNVEKVEEVGKTGIININTASLAQLDSLPGIGQVYSQKIIDYRTKNGPFSSIEDLKKVSGIGEALFNKIKDQISVF